MPKLADESRSLTSFAQPGVATRKDGVTLPDLPTMVRGLWHRRWLLASGALAGTFALATASYLIEPRYRATTRFIVQSGGDIQVPAALQGLVAQLGVSGPAAQSPDFYVALARQPTIAIAIMGDTFPKPDLSQGEAPLLTVLGIDTSAMEPREIEEEALASYHDRTQARVNSRTGIVEVAFDAPDPQLAADVANRIVAKLAQFDIALRRTSGSNTRVFLDQRVEEARAELRRANEGLEAFLTANRDFANSPRLSIVYDRLRRETSRLESQYEQLVLQRDRARIDEISSIPALSIVDSAAAPFRRASPKRRLWAFLGLVLGGAATTVLIALIAVGETEGASAWTAMRRGAALVLERLVRFI